jgi:tetratricopeptide (TPR) repeat protein
MERLTYTLNFSGISSSQVSEREGVMELFVPLADELSGSPFKTSQELCDALVEHLAAPSVQEFVIHRGLSSAEAWAWTLWSADCPALYQQMQSADPAPHLNDWLQYLRRSFQKLEAYDGIVYRFSSRTTIASGSTINFPPLAAASSSLSKRLFDTIARDADLLLIVEVNGGKMLGPLSMFPNDAEIVLPLDWTGTVQRFLSITEHSNLDEWLGLDTGAFAVAEVFQGDHSQRTCLAQECVRRHLVSAIVSNPNEPSPWLKLGSWFETCCRDFNAAKRCLKQALTLNPDDSSLHAAMADLLICHFADAAGALRHLEEALRTAPANDDIHNDVAILLKEHFYDYSRARQHYETALRLNPDKERTHNNLANLLRDKFADFEGARAHYEEALRLNPQYERARKNYAAMLEGMGEIERAEKLLGETAPPSETGALCCSAPAQGHNDSDPRLSPRNENPGI